MTRNADAMLHDYVMWRSWRRRRRTGSAGRGLRGMVRQLLGNAGGSFSVQNSTCLKPRAQHLQDTVQICSLTRGLLSAGTVWMEATRTQANGQPARLSGDPPDPLFDRSGRANTGTPRDGRADRLERRGMEISTCGPPTATRSTFSRAGTGDRAIQVTADARDSATAVRELRRSRKRAVVPKAGRLLLTLTRDTMPLPSKGLRVQRLTNGCWRGNGFRSQGQDEAKEAGLVMATSRSSRSWIAPIWDRAPIRECANATAVDRGEGMP